MLKLPLPKLQYEKLLFLIVGFILGITAVRLVQQYDQQTVSATHPVREASTSYTFINPLLFYEIPNAALLPQYQPLATKIKKLVSNLESSKKTSHVSVYYRDLSLGNWIGIDENEQYTPASLLKVVLMISYLKQAETNPWLLSKSLRFTPELQTLTSKTPYDHGTELKAGAQYTISDLIDRMVINSDNGSAVVLLDNANKEILDQVYTDLSLDNPDTTKNIYRISAHDYASFFRILYNATYLSREMSERALTTLSKSNFKDGLVAGVKPKISIAHKYGESITTRDNLISSIELHDCGIVYYPQKPYLLCIMTQGNNLDDLKDVLKQISAVVYQNMAR